MKSIKIISIFLLISVIGSLFSVSASAKKSDIKTYKGYKYIEVNNKKEICIIGLKKNGYKFDGKKITMSFPKKIKEKKVTEVDLGKIYRNTFPVGYVLTKDGDSIPMIINIHSKIKKINSSLEGDIYWINVSKKNKHYCSKGGVLYNKKKTVLVQYNRNHPRKKYTVPKTVKVIGDCALSYSDNLERINLNNGLKIIGNFALYNSFNKYKENNRINKIPKTVKIIKKSAFGNVWLNNGRIRIPKSVKKIGKENFGFFSYPYYPRYIKSFIIEGKKGSAAWKYAKKHKLKFKAV